MTRGDPLALPFLPTPARRAGDRATGRLVVGAVALLAVVVVVIERISATEPWIVATAPPAAAAAAAVLLLLALDRIEPDTAGRITVAALAVVYLGGYVADLLGTVPAGRDSGALAFRAVTTVILLSGAAYVTLGPRAGRRWSAAMLVVWFIGSVTVFRMDAETAGATGGIGDLALPVLRASAVVVAVLVLFDLAASVAGRLASRAASARAVVRATSRLAFQDDLTALPNRRATQEALDDLARQGGGCVVLADVDRFKRFNDEFGHLEGDRVLQNVGTALLTSVRGGDVVGRWGGEEFLLVVRDADEAAAARVAERCRRAVAAIDAPRPVTASFGVAALGPGTTVEEAVRRADAALYAAKDQGRDRVEVAAGPGPMPERTEGDPVTA